MKVALHFNPRSGAGLARREAQSLAEALRKDGMQVIESEVGQNDSRLDGNDALVVVGGDGTVRSVLNSALQAGVPLYHFPLGTENLFAREFGMNRRIDAVRSALRGRNTRQVDVGRCNGSAFSIMVSIGPDAGVVHRLARTRNGPISHATYVRPTLAECFAPSLGPIRVQVDGKEVAHGRTGWLVIANSRQYALRQDPAPSANTSDGVLDVAFFPARTVWAVMGWTALARLRIQHRFRSFVRARGSEIRVECPERPLPLQLDGEAGDDHVGAGDSAVTITLDPKRLNVLCHH